MKLTDIRNIGPVTLDRLNANKIYTPEELLLFFPKKYAFFMVSNEGIFSGEQACFRAKVASRPVLIISRGKSKAFVFYVMVDNKKVKCLIFSAEYLRFKLQVGIDIICYGKYKIDDNEFILQNIFFENFLCKIDVDYGIPDIKNKLISNAVKACLAENISINDYLPQEIQEKYRLLSLLDTIKLAHFPRDISDCKKVRRRMRYEDFFWYTASLESLKILRAFDQKEPKVFDWKKIEEVKKSLPYKLTVDQEKVSLEILNDLNASIPMNRLVQGDVGSGKTIVAFIASIATIIAGYQVAFMAPTEILVNQHYEAIHQLFPDIRVEILTKSVKEKDRQDILFRLMHKRIDIVLGTHSLLEDKVIFSKLGLVIIDEQHRFGVNQRKKLLDKINGVDALYLTATPIPRTLGLTNFGDLELSIIKTKPLNRKDVITKIVSEENLNSLGKLLLRHLALEEQIYIVVPLINENEALDYIDINKANEIFSSLLPNAKIAMLHGKMKSSAKDCIMRDFKNHLYDCLISTTVIEVGIDVKNATVMVILDADRYGLSQIHQLRGRVGRGSVQSFCYLVSKRDYVKRLEILEKENDGFVLAEEDFKLRGPGDYLGEEQSGFSNLNFDFDSNDNVIWSYAKEDSKEYIYKYLNKEYDNDRFKDIFANISYKKTKIN